jgi:2OG-Fe(II) oxygenase superfamily
MADALFADGDGRWTAHSRPFLHIHATNVFPSDTYRRLSTEFAAIVDRTVLGTTDGARMAKSSENYDALVHAMDASLASRFAPMFTREWVDYLAQLVDLPVTTRIDGALHHVPRNSRSGWLHTDLCSAWFNASTNAVNGVVFSDRSACDYFTGDPRDSAAKPEEYIRAATMIYYINNDNWRHGEGGETELYSTSLSHLGPKTAIPPTNNSLLLFECSPHSFHRLIANPGRPRNSIVLWLHTSVSFSEARWGSGVSRRRAT